MFAKPDTQLVPDKTDRPQHSRRFWLNLLFLCSALGLCEAARGIVVPTLSLYAASLGGSSTFLSVIVAAFSVGRLLASVVLGYVSDHCSMMAVLMGSLAVTCVGHVLFAAADVLGTGGLYLLLFSRLLTGFGTGILSVCRSFVSKHTQASERTRFMAWLGIVQFAGYAFTPILGGLEVSLPITANWTVNTFTAGTYVLLLLDMALLVGLYCGMRGQQWAEGEEEAKAAKAREMITAEAAAVMGAATAGEDGGRQVGCALVEGTEYAAVDDEAMGEVQSTPRRSRQGYSAVQRDAADHDDSQSGSNRPDNDDEKEEKCVDELHSAPLTIAHTERSDDAEEGLEHKLSPADTVDAALDHASCSYRMSPSVSVVVEQTRDTRHRRAHPVITPSPHIRRPSLSASLQPLTVEHRDTAGPAGLTTSTLASLSASSLPRDVLSSSSLASLDLAVSELPRAPSIAASSSGDPTDAPQPARLAAFIAYIRPANGILIPVFFLLLNSVSRGCLAVAETYGSVLFYSVQYGPQYDPSTVSPLGAAWFYTALGAVGVLVFVLMDSFTHFLNELTLLCWGFIASAVHSYLHARQHSARCLRCCTPG